MSDIKNFGIKGVGDNVQFGKRNPRIKVSSTKLQVRTGDDAALTQIQAEDPVTAQDVATKNYVDTNATQDVLYRQVTINFNDTSPIDIGAALPLTAKVQKVKVQVTTAWDALLTTLTVSLDGGATLMTSTENDLFEASTFVTEMLGSAVVGATNQLIATLSGGSPTQGSAIIFVEYTKG